MILVDSNVPMYLVGADPGLKDAALRALDEAVSRDEPLVTDAEVLQEILHRYSAIGRTEAIQPAFDAILDVVDDVLPVGLSDVEEAKRIILGSYKLSARDAIHVAVMRSAEITRILTFDTSFDRLPGIDRVS